MIPRPTIFSRLITMLLVASSLLATGSVQAGESARPGLRDGQHDFDFDIGTWKTHSKRLLKPLTGSKRWVEMNGVTVVRPVWGGKANLAELDSDGPNGHLELISLRLYDTAANQWNLNFANPRVGILNVAGESQGVPLIGRFDNGVGTFYDQETYDGRTIWIRFMIRPLTPTTARLSRRFPMTMARPGRRIGSTTTPRLPTGSRQ